MPRRKRTARATRTRPAIVTETRVASLGELIDRITPEQPDSETGRWRDTGVYRGSPDARRPLLTSLDRLGGENPPHTKSGLEEHILRNFARYSRPHFSTPPANDWELLVAAQHHGVPTRLLDWSYSPLVAAHFATLPRRDSSHENDRAVWRLDWQAIHREFAFPELALLITDLEQQLGGSEPCTPWALFAGRTNREAFACMLEPPSLDARIVAQAAVFTLCSDRSRSFDAFLGDHGLSRALSKFVIPAAHVARVRDQLDTVGMDERRLFPDVDGLAAELRRYYS
jgi:hypothetical protein